MHAAYILCVVCRSPRQLTTFSPEISKGNANVPLTRWPAQQEVIHAFPALNWLFANPTSCQQDIYWLTSMFVCVDKGSQYIWFLLKRERHWHFLLWFHSFHFSDLDCPWLTWSCSRTIATIAILKWPKNKFWKLNNYYIVCYLYFSTAKMNLQAK